MHYDTLAPDYARHRGVLSHVVEELIRSGAPSAGSRVLEVGCGTGVHVLSLHDTAGSCCFGVDRSRGMIAEVRCRAGAEFVCAGAEQLPFEDGVLDLVFSVNVIHHLSSPQRYFCEARRALRVGGLICTFTDTGEIIRRRRPLSQYWPASARVDLERYPTLESLRSDASASGFDDLCQTEVRATFEVTSAAPYRDRVFSCLRAVPDEEFEQGLTRLENDLALGVVEGVSELVALWGVARGPAPSSAPAI